MRGASRLLAAAIALSCLTTAACSAQPPAPDPRQTEIMDRIEAKLHLPAGASSLTSYARTYAYAADGRVIGSYFVPIGQNDDSFCRGAKRAGPDNGQIALACPPPDGMTAGERRWYKNPDSLPAVDDGGCAFVDIEFDLTTNTVTHADCHGPA